MRITTIALAIAMSGFGVSMAEAMPMPAVDSGTAAGNVVKVDYACGRGYHLSRWGNCRPNWRQPPPPRYYGGGYGYGRPRWDRPPPPRYGWGYERSWGYRGPPPWARDRYRY